MHVRRAAGGLSAALTMAMVLCACGEASSASSNAPIPAADVSAAAANPVAVSPLPGTEDASPATQISFLGVPARELRNRCSPQVARVLLDTAWWDWPAERISRNREFFATDITTTTPEALAAAIVP